MDIQWYPGHMTKARRQMEEDLKLVDLIIELVDARVPFSSRNPDICGMGTSKGRMIILNKADLADEKSNRLWLEADREQGAQVLLADSRSRASLREVQPLVQEACREKIERDRRRGIKNRPVRAMVCGIPNVGKSTFINSIAGRASAKTGNRPGVTRGKQWIRLNKSLELLDTPGILWPRFDDPLAGERLAMIGSVNDTILNTEELALRLIAFLSAEYPEALPERYGISCGKETAGPEVSPVSDTEFPAASDTEMLPSETLSAEAEILRQIAVSRSCLLRGGGLDWAKAAGILLDEFRGGKLGRITLENP